MSRKRCFKGLACHFELLLGLLNITKYDIGEVEKMMFQVVAGHSELIASILTITKCGSHLNRRFINSKKVTFSAG